jgi:uncharacterized damage-inducible protein DinB
MAAMIGSGAQGVKPPAAVRWTCLKQEVGPMANVELAHDLLAHARAKLEEHMAQVARCAGLLSADELWHRDNEHTNSVGNLLLHLTGNVRQWILGGLGGQPVARNRPAEFAERGPLPVAPLVGALHEAIAQAGVILAKLDAAALAARRNIQGYEVSGQIAVCHVLEHFAFHTGQIVHMTKVLKNVDLSLYDAEGHKRPGGGVAP